MALVFGFPGQGSQIRGMGRQLFDEFPERVEEADSILGYSIRELCLEDSGNQLRQTQFTQPALFFVCALTYLQRNSLPDFAAGHSLGEYSALFAAGVFDFSAGLRLVQRRGELMSKASVGSLAAVLGLSSSRIREVLQQERFDEIDIANLNSDTQTVIAGRRSDLEKASAVFAKAGARYVPLNVSAAFHSRLMKGTAEMFRSFLETFPFSPPTFPVIANVTAQPYGCSASEIRDLLARQIDGPVNWLKSMRLLLQQPEVEFQEIGPGQVLSKLWKEIEKTRTQDRVHGPKIVLSHPAHADETKSGQSLASHNLPAGGQVKQPAAFQQTSRRSDAPLFMYSGIGTHSVGMGKGLRASHATFRRALEECASIVNPLLDADLLSAVYPGAGSAPLLSRAEYSGPAVFAIGLGLTRLLQEEGIEPGALLGYGSGEILAMHIAGVLSLKDSISLHLILAQAVERRCQNSAMMTVLAPENIQKQHPSIFDGCHIAGSNFDTHFIVSGEPSCIATLREALRQQGIVTFQVDVEYGWNTPMIELAEQQFLQQASALTWRMPQIPVFSPTLLDWVDAPNAQYEWKCCRSRVRFGESVQRLKDFGVTKFFDLGPTGTLSNFVRYQLKEREYSATALNSLSADSSSFDSLLTYARRERLGARVADGL